MPPVKRHPPTSKPTTASPKSEPTLGPTATTKVEADTEAKAKAEAEAAAARMRADIDRILERRPPTEEEIERLTAASKQFYQHTMDLKRQRRRRRLGVCAALGAVGVLGWWAYSYLLG